MAGALDNLMNTLSRKTNLISDFLEALVCGAKLKDTAISIAIAGWSWTERTPLPSIDCLKRNSSIVWKKAGALALPHVSNPRSERNVLTIKKFDMCRWHAGVTLTTHELLEGSKVFLPPEVIWDAVCFGCHRANISSVRCQIQEPRESRRWRGGRGYWDISPIGIVEIFSSTDGGGKQLSFLFYQAARRQIKKILFFCPPGETLTHPLYIMVVWGINPRKKEKWRRTK